MIAKHLRNSELIYEGTACILLIAKGVRNNEKTKASFKNRKGSAHIIDSNALHNNSELVYEGTARILLIAKGIRNDSFDLRLFVRDIWVGIY